MSATQHCSKALIFVSVQKWVCLVFTAGNRVNRTDGLGAGAIIGGVAGIEG